MLRIKQFIISLSVLSVLFNQLAPAYADVIVDTAAPSNHQASMDTAPNGVPVVNITTPDGNGLSHNKFKTFDVDHNGVVLNNSAVVKQSQLGGHVFGNPNLTLGNEAETILGEVTSGNSSSIMGMIEVLGPSANFILSNNNGITCNGCGFINIPRATFTTGNPIFNDGKLYGFSVDKGRISIEGEGANAEDSSYFDIIARAADINAAVHGQEISVIAGRNDVAFGNGSITPKADNGTAKPSFAIDSQALGGMYGNRISLIGTEAGVGVRAPTNMVSDTGDIVINADGTVTTGKITSGANVQIASQENVVIDEKLCAAQDASVTAQQDVVINEGQQLSSAGSIDVKARNLTLEQESSITAGLDESGNSNGEGALAADLSESLEVKSDSLLYASKEITAEARNIIVSGFVDADQDVNLHTSADIINNNVISADSGTVHLSADGEITNNKIISSDNGAVALTAQGRIQNKTDASISSWKELELASDGSIDNAGKILAQSSVNASAKAGFSNTGTVSALGDINLQSEQTITNSNTLVSGADILIKSDKLRKRLTTATLTGL
jgi:filamentous hemagglutinin family protein